MFGYTYSKYVVTEQLSNEISSLGTFADIIYDSSTNILIIRYENQLSGPNEILLNNFVSNHIPNINYSIQLDSNKINGVTVSSATPSVNDVLKYTLDGWVPSQVTSSGSTYSISNKLIVSKSPNSGEFSSIASALSSISDNSITNPYVIYVAPGLYIEDTINMKKYVAIIGDSYNTTFIQIDSTSKDIIIGNDQSYIGMLSLQGATDNGKCAINYSSATGLTAAFFNVENVKFGANNILAKSTGISEQSCTIQLTNVKFGGPDGIFDKGFIATSDGTTNSFSTIQIRNSTTTNGGFYSVNNFAIADGPSCQIVANSLQLSRLTASGTAFQAKNGGRLRITGVNINRWNIGIDIPDTGTFSNVSALGMNFENNIQDINILQPYSYGSIENAKYSKSSIIDTSLIYIQDTDVRTIKVRKKGGDYDSIVDALSSITDNSSTNRYVIDIGAGEFTETLIDLSSKPHVNLKGQTINSTIIYPLNTNQHIIKIGEMNEVSFLTLDGSGYSYSGIYALDCGVFSQLHKVSFNNCDIGILVQNSNLDSEFYGEYVDFDGDFRYGVKGINTGTYSLFLNLENCYCFPTSLSPICYDMSGIGLDFHLELSGNSNDSGSQGGTAISIYDGANSDVSNAYFYNFNNAISLPNNGTFSTAHFLSVKNENCVTDINVQNPYSRGSFQGAMNIPNISITSSATFGVQYLDSLLGNKKEIYFDSASFNLITGTVPTTSAATRSIITTSGYSFVTLTGVLNATTGCSANFRIPKDYLRNGRFKVVYTTDSTAGNIKLQFIITRKTIGEQMSTIVENGLSIVFSNTTAFLMQETNWINSSTTYTAGDTISIRIYRLANDAADTTTGACYVSGLLFEYEGHK